MKILKQLATAAQSLCNQWVPQPTQAFWRNVFIRAHCSLKCISETCGAACEKLGQLSLGQHYQSFGKVVGRWKTKSTEGSGKIARTWAKAPLSRFWLMFFHGIAACIAAHRRPKLFHWVHVCRWANVPKLLWPDVWSGVPKISCQC